MFQITNDRFQHFLFSHLPSLKALDVEEHVVGYRCGAVLLHPLMPLLIEGIREIRKAWHHLLADNLDAHAAQFRGSCNAILQGHLPQEVLLLEAVQTNSPLDRVIAVHFSSFNCMPDFFATSYLFLWQTYISESLSLRGRGLFAFP